MCFGACKSFQWLKYYMFSQENAPLEEVFQHLKCTRDGLTSDEVSKRLELFGYNKLEEKKVVKLLCLVLHLYVFDLFVCV